MARSKHGDAPLPSPDVQVVETRTATVRLTESEITDALYGAAMIKAHRVKSVQFLPIVSKFTLEFDYEEYGDRNMTGATVTIVENMSERKERGGSS